MLQDPVLQHLHETFVKTSKGCLRLLTEPISPTGPLFSFLIAHGATFQFFARILRAKGWPSTTLGKVAVILAALFLASFLSLQLWKFICRLFSEGYGETNEILTSPSTTRVARLLGIGAVLALGVVYLHL